MREIPLTRRAVSGYLCAEPTITADAGILNMSRQESERMTSDPVRFLCPANVAARVLDGEAVMIHLETGRYYSAEGVAAVLWEPLSAGVDVEEIGRRTAEHFSLNVEQVRQDLRNFVSELTQEELLVADPGEATGGAGSIDFGTTGYTTPSLQSYRDMADLLALDPPLPSVKFNG
jgi:hypothetical protein